MKAIRRRNQGSVILFAVAMLVFLAMIGTTYVLISHADRRESRAMAAVAPMKNQARGVLDYIAAERGGDRFLTPEGTVYGTATNYRAQIDYPSEAGDRILSTVEPISHPSIHGGAWTWLHVSECPNDKLTNTNYGYYTNVPVTDGNLVDADGDGIKDSYLWPAGGSDHSVSMTAMGTTNVLNMNKPYYVAWRVVDAGGLLNVNSADGVGADSTALPDTPMPVTNIDLNAALTAAVRGRIHAANVSPYLGRLGTSTDAIAVFNSNVVTRPLNPMFSVNPPPPIGYYLPFDATDQMALSSTALGIGRLVYLLDPASPPVPGPNYLTYRKYLTCWSAAGDFAPWRTGRDADMTQQRRVDLNCILGGVGVAPLPPLPAFTALFPAFYKALPPDSMNCADKDRDTYRRRMAAQLAVNVIDFTDADSLITASDVTVTVGDPPTPVVERFFGNERQPFISKAWTRVILSDSNRLVASAVELYNPYATKLDISNLHMKVGGTGGGSGNLVFGATSALPVPPHGRLVIVSDKTKILTDPADESRGNAGVDGGTIVLQDPSLYLDQPVTFLQPGRLVNDGSTVYAPIGRLEPSDFGGDAFFGVTEAEPGPRFCRLRRDDNPVRCRYTVARYESLTGTGTNGTPTYYKDDPAVVTTAELGKPNAGALVITGVAPTPVYVRDGKMINVGDVLRLYAIGAKAATASDPAVPLDIQLANALPADYRNGRLPVLANPFNGTDSGGALNVAPGKTTLFDPGLPPACMLSDYFQALCPNVNNANPFTNGQESIPGQININTAPVSVLKFLPGISLMTNKMLPGNTLVDDRTLVATEIVAYRDKLDASASGGHNYYATGSRATVTNIPGLRQGVAGDVQALPASQGFATSGEIDIPLRTIIGWNVANNTFGQSPPNAYTVADPTLTPRTDDGLDSAIGKQVQNDLSKYEIYYSWLSNQITVRSDIYIVYILVQTDSNPNTAGAKRRYIGVIDRTNVKALGQAARVLMFAEVR